MSESAISENDRTNPIGLFNYANSYWRSALVLQNASILEITHPSAPIEFLLIHAAELFLKSYLRLTHSVDELKNIGHRLLDLHSRCTDIFSENDERYQDIVKMISFHEINSMTRYIYTGARNNYPTIQQLNELCSFLYTKVKPKLSTTGLPVR